MIEEFEKWWEAHGQFVRAGGGQYEISFAWAAWQAAYAQGRADQKSELNKELKLTFDEDLKMAALKEQEVEIAELKKELDAAYDKGRDDAMAELDPQPESNNGMTFVDVLDIVLHTPDAEFTTALVQELVMRSRSLGIEYGNTVAAKALRNRADELRWEADKLEGICGAPNAEIR